MKKRVDYFFFYRKYCLGLRAITEKLIEVHFGASVVK